MARRLRSWARQASRDRLLLALCVALGLLGGFLRVQHLGSPDAFTFDEHHFVDNARNYISGLPDGNDHPPLGKLLMVPSILALGDNGTGWRAAQLAFGMWSIVCGALLAAFLFRDRRAGWLAGAFLAGDGFLIAYSRTALLDGILAALVLTTLLFAVRARSPLGFAAVGIAIGCAASIKVVGFVLVLPVAALCFCQRRRFTSLAMLGLAPVVFMLLEMAGLALAREPCSPVDAWAVALRRLAGQSGASYFMHPLTSRWYTWFLPMRPIVLRYESSGPESVRALTMLGNPLLWWSATAALAGSAVAAVAVVVRAARARSVKLELGSPLRGTLLLFSFAVALLAPWMTGLRDSYIYHYLPAYSLLLVLVGGLASRIYRGKRGVAQLFALAVALVSLFYAPVWGQIEISSRGYEARLLPWTDRTEPPRLQFADVERCERGVDQAGLEASRESARAIYYRECAIVYAELECREAFRGAGALPNAEQLPAISSACAAAYCRRLPAEVEMCRADFRPTPEATLRAWPALNAAIIAHDASYLAPRITAAMVRFYVALQRLQEVPVTASPPP